MGCPKLWTCSLVFLLGVSYYWSSVCLAHPMISEYEYNDKDKQLEPVQALQSMNSSDSVNDSMNASDLEDSTTISPENSTTSINGLVISGVIFEIGVLEHLDNLTSTETTTEEQNES